MQTGRVEPRIWTPPLRELTPDTSYGFDVIDFAQEIGWPLDPWQKWVLIHLGELKENGDPRFRFCLILVARQNGKTTLCRVLILYWMFIELHPLIVGTSTKRETAKDSWRKTIKMAENNELLRQYLSPIHTRETIGEEDFFNTEDSHYMFAAPNRNAGRSYTVNRALLDELRDHKTWDTFDGLTNAGNAVMDFQAVAITNQGDDQAVVLDSQRQSALDFIETQEGNSSLFLAEYSAPSGCDPTDPEALAMANPNLGIRLDLDNLMGNAMQAKKEGGARLAKFRTEVLCQRVHLLDPAIEPDLWDNCGTTEPINLAKYRRSVVLCLDVSMGGDHATLIACAEIEGTYHVEVIHVWKGFGCTKKIREELGTLVELIKPRAIGWFPNGPASAIAADLKAKPNWNKPWPPRNVKVIELSSEVVPSVCMGLADIVHSGELQHGNDPMLTSHVRQTQKLKRGDAWIYTRSGSGPVDATYAMAGAVHLSRTLPAPLKPVSTGRVDQNEDPK